MKKAMFVLISVLVLSTLVLSACAQPTAAPTKAPVATEAPAATEPPAPQPTEAPKELGTAENPIIIALAPSATAEQLTVGGEAIAAKMKELTGLTYSVIIPNSYTALIEAMASGNAHIGFMPTLAYLLGKQAGAMDVKLVVVRNGSDFYGAQFIAHKDMGFTPYFDPNTNTDTADAATALAQFEGKRPCFTDPLSVSGYVIPFGVLKEQGVNFKTPAAVQSHPAVVQALYAGVTVSGDKKVGAICDFGATYIDARTSDKIHTDVNEKIVVIWRTDNIIPNDNISFSSAMPEEIGAKVYDGFVAMAADEAGKEIFKNAGYEIEDLKPAEDSFYDAFRSALQASGVDITTMVK
ncbi:MAG TPA: phosphate/phosphite/phosphonate ABC transporter substrate-binding protein [Anaerolineaceae bacterium]|nr:phosphate/phosphite/phosphonate ABC transporter substrate-binding protein [Anaerolineaceae bacterium]NMC18218.1 phosphate/phosphite/phosphonate ABC transporter substrate-binding protein [Chloroflexota bacterium]HNS06886.1 phosphate/phosphite/phosphonate ABC transporter substrate-binding protein [Anaerolineaceae bacterium]HNW13199.1 phosphate/phosphite/phosphonate ABC transporter substrate-binding protein [Anaerolineaceae bacterium]HOQ69996.1 phosphate/phosphite/phosphonate ABC transporter su